jgi:hypothetical protein
MLFCWFRLRVSLLVESGALVMPNYGLLGRLCLSFSCTLHPGHPLQLLLQCEVATAADHCVLAVPFQSWLCQRLVSTVEYVIRFERKAEQRGRAAALL